MGAIAWLGGSLDAAFAQARADNKPVFLYWGAGWCPPCNRQKALLFPKLPVEGVLCYHLDGDTPGAQGLAERFKLRSYPTNVLFRADGTELTRLPCEVDAPRFASLFSAAAASTTPVGKWLDAALANTPLPDEAWTLLAWYSWDTDEGVLLKGRDPAALLGQLAAACPLADARTRFAWFHAQAGGNAMETVIATLDDAGASAVQRDLVLNWTADLVRRTEPGSGTRTRLVQAWLLALERIEADIALPIVDRLQALRNRARLARLGGEVPNLHATARARVDTAMLSVSEPAMRHAMVNTAAGVLSDAGLVDEAAQLLKDELARSHAPYYFMHNLAAIEKKRGNPAQVVNWYRQAFEAAKGSATRIQWGVSYVLALLDNTPEAKQEVDAALAALRAAVAAAADSASQRNGAQLKKLAARIPLA